MHLRVDPGVLALRALAHERLVVREHAVSSTGIVVVGTGVANAAAALRASPRRSTRFIGEALNAAPNSGCDIAINSRASVRASPLVPNVSRGAYGEPSGNASQT